MLAVAIGSLGALLVSVSVLGRLLVSQQRAHARREDLLVNQLMHLAGKTWSPAPAESWGPADTGEPLVRDVQDWTAAPEQQPLYSS